MQNSNYIPQPTKHFHGYAVVRLNGRDLYLGRYGSPEARAKYQTLISDWLANGRQLPEAPVSINEVILAYDSDAVVELMEEQGATAIIPSKSNRKNPRHHDRTTYQERNRIERLINRLKQCRRIATRYDKTSRNFLAFLYLAGTMLWLA